jgi:predicted N-acetyltransferase YhbS
MSAHPAPPAGSSTPALIERIHVREANESDNQGLLALTRATPMAGTISIRIDREPDFFALLRLRGEAKVFVAVRGNDVIGCISAALRSTYVMGAPETIAYIGDMKIAPQFSGGRTALRLIQSLEAYLRSMGVDLCFGVAAEGNRRALPLFEGRLGTPQWAPLGRFLVDEMLTSPFKGSAGKYSIGTADVSDEAAIVALLNRFYRERQFAPQISEEDVASMLVHQKERASTKLFVARAGDKTVGVMGLYDAAAAKQNVLLNAPAMMRAALALFRMGVAPFANVKIPRIGDTVHLLYVRTMACDDDHWEAFTPLLRQARTEAFQQRFALLALGLHERDPLRSLLRTLPRFTFSSLAFVTSLNAPKRLAALSSGIPFEDFALV